jgi:hypothetical protein
MRCSSCEPRLDAYLEAALPRRQARAIAAHLHACRGCAALLRELRVVDALLSTTRPPKVAPDFTASVVSATHVTQPKAPRRMPIVAALLLYVGVAWVLAAIAALRWHEVAGLATALLAEGQRDLTALGAVARALAPATPLAAATVTGVLLIDLLLLGAIFYGYRRVRPMLALYLARGPRS